MMDATCLSCFRSHVKCEKSIPCRRCQRLNLRCVPNPRPRGRPKKSAFSPTRPETGRNLGGGGGGGGGLGGGGGGMMGGPPMLGRGPPPPYHPSQHFQHPHLQHPHMGMGMGMVPPPPHPMAMGMGMGAYFDAAAVTGVGHPHMPPSPHLVGPPMLPLNPPAAMGSNRMIPGAGGGVGPADDDQNSSTSSSSSSYSSASSLSDAPAAGSNNGAHPFESLLPSSIGNPALRQQVQRQLQLQHHHHQQQQAQQQQQQQQQQRQRQQQQQQQHPPPHKGPSHVTGGGAAPNQQPNTEARGPSSSTSGPVALSGVPAAASSAQLIYPPFGRVGGGGGGPSTSASAGKSSSNKSSAVDSSTTSTSSASSGSSDEDGGRSSDGSICSMRSDEGSSTKPPDAKEGGSGSAGGGGADMALVAAGKEIKTNGNGTAMAMVEDGNPPTTTTVALKAANGAPAEGAPGSVALKMMGPFVNMLSGGEVAVERTRHLLTSWHLWSLETGGGSNGSNPTETESRQQAKEDLKEVASLIRLTLPVSVAAWAESRGTMASAAAATVEEEEQVQSFLDMCVDDDGSAICSAVYSGGRLQLTLNSRFAAMYMTLEELEATVARDKLRPELVWRRLLSPECSSAYDEALCQAYFKGQNLGGEACEIIKCVDRFGLEMPCFMRLRIFASSQGAITASVIFLLPLQLSRLVESS